MRNLILALAAALTLSGCAADLVLLPLQLLQAPAADQHEQVAER